MDGTFWDREAGYLTEDEFNYTSAIRKNFGGPRRTSECYNVMEFSFEEAYIPYIIPTTIFFRRYWWIGFPICAVYLALIFGGRSYMRHRPAYVLRRTLICWNSTIALFSIFLTFKFIPYTVSEIYTGHFYSTACFANYMDFSCQRLFIYGWLFGLSKVVELGDTAFIVLRKKPLLFLHWYHHVTVLLFCWYSMGKGASIAVGLFFVVNNAAVHAFMYTYYALRALGVHVPRWASMSLTLLQISQMLVAIYLNLLAYHLKRTTYP
ncbi:unnamed protein product, partial [Cyprideis torosa]